MVPLGKCHCFAAERIVSITSSLVIFPNPESYLRLVTVYLMEYSEDWSVTNAYLSEDSLNSLNEQAA